MAGLKPAREKRKKKTLSRRIPSEWVGAGSLYLTTICGLVSSASHEIGKPRAPGRPKWERLLFAG